MYTSIIKFFTALDLFVESVQSDIIRIGKKLTTEDLKLNPKEQRERTREWHRRALELSRLYKEDILGT